MTVLRWHADPSPALRNSGDTIDAHQKRVAALCLELAARVGLPLMGSDLLLAALHHDEAERILGDIPAPAKARFPELAAAYAQAEAQVMAELAPPGWRWKLSDEEAAILRLADRADAWRWAVTHGQGATEEWQQAKRECMAAAWAAGPDCAAWWESFVREVEGAA